MGAFLFREIEGDDNVELFPEVIQARNETAEKLWRLLEDRNIFDEINWRERANEELKNFTGVVTRAIENGYAANETMKNAKKWIFPGAFLYSLTVITTIGYGNVSPKKPWGKLVTILYAIVGMPLFLLYLSNIGDILARCFKWLYAKCCLCRWCPNVAKKREERRRQKEAGYDEEEIAGISPQNSPNNWQRRHAVATPVEELQLGKLSKPQLEYGEEECEEEGSIAETNATFDEYDSQTVTVPITICLSIMVGYICGGIFLFASYENWGWLDAAYFCFISLSTIGFGDIVPGTYTYETENVTWSFVFCAIYLMLGMALIAMCFNLMQEEVIAKIRSIMRTVKRICR